MDNNTVLVLANPTEPQLAMLEQLPPETNIAVGNSVEAFENTAPSANIIYNWSLSGALLREVFLLCPRVQWVHTRSAGLDNILFPELIASPVPVTNGTGVFSPSLGEFALAAILFFAKDLRRMVRNQEAGRWEQFDITEISGQTVGIVGYGDIGRAVATRVRADGHAGPGGEAARRAALQHGSFGVTDLRTRSTAGDAAAVRLRGGLGAADAGNARA